ncbi:MAG: PorV/PorQ family protein [Candidatus Cloacimonetes bacterium]|nr:PorV/PorQ family protein [Candidatus Cloacimonadota bacterium]
MKKILVIIILALGISVWAEVDGSRGFQMLRILSDPATAGQAGSGAVNSESGFNYLDNAAAGLLTRVKAVSFSQNMWLFDTSMSNIGYRNSNGRKSFGFAIRYLDYGTIENRNEQGIEIGEYHPMDMNIIFNFGYRLLSSHFLGVNLRGLYEKIDDSSATGISADLGYIYLTPIQDLKLLAALKNFGSTSKMDNEEIDLPFTAELGLSKDLELNGSRITAESRLIKDIDNDKLKAAIGAEALFMEQILLRAGYKFNYALESFSCGFGIRMKRFEFNYAYNPINEDLDDVHYLGINLKF